MRVLVTGAAGQLGHELVDAFEGHEVVALDHASLDVTDRESVLDTVTTRNPDAIVHAAAWTAVDDCESDPDRALVVNAEGTRHVADAAQHVGARMCLISTDYVFDGTKRDPYTEDDAPNPRSAYGRSKLAAERELAGHPDATIVRVSWLSGRYGQNMVKTILRLAAGDIPTLRFVDDQRGHPTFADDAARMIRDLVVEHPAGVYHVTHQGVVTWFDFARAVLESAGHDPERVEPISTEELDPPRPAPRPANSVLDNAALRTAGIKLLPHYREPLDRLVHQLLHAG